MLSSVTIASQAIPPAPGGVSPSDRRLSDPPSESADTLERSALSSMFGELGLHSSSRIDAVRDRIDFNFSFTSSTKESLSASGFVAQREQHASLSLTYTFQKAVVVDGKRELKSFQASILFETDTSQSLSVKPFKNKEDILHFLGRLMDDVVNLLQDDSRVLSGISLNQDDMAELMGRGKGKVKKLSEGLVAAIMTMAFLKRIQRESDAGQNGIVTEQRQAAGEIHAENTAGGNFSFSIGIKEMDAVSQTLAKTGLAAAAAQAASASPAAQSAPAGVRPAAAVANQRVNVSAA